MYQYISFFIILAVNISFSPSHSEKLMREMYDCIAASVVTSCKGSKF